MLHIRYFCFSLLFLASCQPSQTQKKRLESPSQPKTLDTLLTNVKSESKLVIDDRYEVDAEKLSVDRIHFLEPKDEAYIWLELKDGYDWKAVDTLRYIADSVIYQSDEGFFRSRFPLSKAHEYLKMELIDGISIFNDEHEFQGISSLKRIEYHTDIVEEGFIAVLNMPRKLSGEKFYGLNGAPRYISLSSKKNVNSALKDSLIAKYNPIGTWTFHSITTQPYNLGYAHYSLTDRNEKHQSGLIETSSFKNTDIAPVINRKHYILDLTPVNIQINSRPILLLTFGVPETCGRFTTPAVFDGKHYQLTKSRVFTSSRFKSSRAQPNKFHARFYNKKDITPCYKTNSEFLLDSAQTTNWTDKYVPFILDTLRFYSAELYAEQPPLPNFEVIAIHSEAHDWSKIHLATIDSNLQLVDKFLVANSWSDVTEQAGDVEVVENNRVYTQMKSSREYHRFDIHTFKTVNYYTDTTTIEVDSLVTKIKLMEDGTFNTSKIDSVKVTYTQPNEKEPYKTNL